MPTDTRHRTLRTLAVVTAVVGAATLTGCTFLQIAWRNVPAALREPAQPAAPPMQLPPPGSRFSVGWVGHATVLVQMGDAWLLTDPVFEERIALVSRRLVQPGIALARVPPLEAVLLSHRHFDHLSPASLRALAGRTKRVFVPPGAAQDVPPGPYEVIELGRWQRWSGDGLEVTAVPVLHSGGRLLLDAATHPAASTGYVVRRDGHSLYFPGDTAYAEPLFTEVAQRLGPVDLALMPICPIAPAQRMHPNHLDPAEALRAAAALHARWMVPIHHDTFVNSLDDPGDCLQALREAMRGNAAVTVEVLPIGGQAVLDRGAR